MREVTILADGRPMDGQTSRLSFCRGGSSDAKLVASFHATTYINGTVFVQYTMMTFLLPFFFPELSIKKNLGFDNKIPLKKWLHNQTFFIR